MRAVVTRRRALARALLLPLVLVILAASTASALADRWTDFSDADWASTYGVSAEQVATVADGFPDGTFRPYNLVTRGQFAKMTLEGLDLQQQGPATPTFLDVPFGHTFFSYVEGAAAAGVITGYEVAGGKEFRPGYSIQRQQTNTILGRYLSGRELEENGSIRGRLKSYLSLEAWYTAEGEFELGGFDDQAEVSPAHRPYTAYLHYRNVVMGKNNLLEPGKALPRAQAVVLVLRVLDAENLITTDPPAPVGLAALPQGPSPDMRPYITGLTIAGGEVQLWDSFGGQTLELPNARAFADEQGEFSIRVPELAEGTHSIRAQVKSVSGRTSALSQPVVYLNDRSAPQGTVLQPLEGQGLRSRRPVFSVAASDTLSGVAAVTFQYRSTTVQTYYSMSTDSMPPYDAAWGDISLSDGDYDFQAIVRDAAGNELMLGPLRVTVDLQAPTVELQAPAAEGVYYTENPFPLFAAAATDPPVLPGVAVSGVARVDFLCASRESLPEDPGTWTAAHFSLLGSDDSPGYSLDPAAWGEGLADGHFVFAVRSVDRAGNESPLDTQEVVLDRAPPLLTLLFPSPEEALAENTPLDILWSTEDVSGVDAVGLEYGPSEEGPWTSIEAAAPNTGSWPWTVPDADQGAAVWLRLTATDRAAAPLGDPEGHTTSIVSGPFSVSEPPPAPDPPPAP